jgi:glucosyl-3-phosphoglycerate phosphatase
VILARHAESEWNLHYGRTRIDPGIPDPPLTARGRDQAQGLAHTLADADLHAIVASPYRRSIETASIVAEALALPITVEPLVRERNAFSCDEGSPPEELARLWPELAFDHLEPLWWGRPPESEAALARRCADFRVRAAEHARHPHLLVVTHWGFIRGMTGREVANATWFRLI